MSKYKITVRVKTAQSAATTANEQLKKYYTDQGVDPQNWPESIRPPAPADNTNTPTAGSYANSYVDPRTGRTVYLDQNLQPIGQNPQYSTPKPSVPSAAGKQVAQQIDQLNQNLTTRDVSNPQYTKQVKKPSVAIPANMNPIRQQALQDQRAVRQKQPVNNQYLQANSALFKALSELGMQNYNAADLQANQEYIKSHINQRFNNNPQFKQMALDLLQKKVNQAGVR
jgi:hypothetical protein